MFFFLKKKRRDFLKFFIWNTLYNQNLKNMILVPISIKKVNQVKKL